ncbi:hypothetical protein BH11ACT8_BH11ACT8_23940 [soil metagenome]
MNLGVSDTWAVPDFPYEPVGSPAVLDVPDAFLTAVRRGELRTLTTPHRWMRGAVHDASGRLVVESQKIGGLVGNPSAPADPPRVSPGDGARRLSGRWLYGGNWMQHFGHFFIETVTTLWPRRAELELPVEGIVFHSYMSRFRGIEPWQLELMALTEYAGVPLEVIEGRPLRVEHLVLPTRSVVVNGWAEPPAVDVWQRMALAAGGRSDLDPAGPRVFFSRAAFNERKREAGKDARTEADRDRDLDATFAAAGFVVVAPEELSIAEQVRLAASASVLAGSAGTALHLSAFAPAGVKVLELGDRRSPAVRVPTQLLIDSAREHPTAFVPHGTPVADLAAALKALGVSD